SVVSTAIVVVVGLPEATTDVVVVMPMVVGGAVICSPLDVVRATTTQMMATVATPNITSCR
ncbi:MAG: hypothetical protein ACKOJ9_06405, partial [Actinomycetota bacterium]